MIDEQRLHEFATRFGEAIRMGWMGWGECHDIMCVAVCRHLKNLSPEESDAVCWRLGSTLTRAAIEPELQASQHVRDAVRPLFARRAPKDAIELAALRAAGDVLTIAQTDQIVRQELNAHVKKTRLSNAR